MQQQWLPTCLSARLWSKAAISDQSLAPQYLEHRVLFANLDCSRLLQEHVYRCLLSVWRMGNRCSAKSWNHRSYLPSLPWQLHVFSRLQSSTVVTSDRFCKRTCCAGGKTGPGASYLAISWHPPWVLAYFEIISSWQFVVSSSLCSTCVQYLVCITCIIPCVQVIYNMHNINSLLDCTFSVHASIWCVYFFYLCKWGRQNIPLCLIYLPLTDYCAQLLQSCPTPCDPMDCSQPGSSIHGIFLARVLEWVAMPFPRGSSQSGDLPNPGIEPTSPLLQVYFFTFWAMGEAQMIINERNFYFFWDKCFKFGCFPL